METARTDNPANPIAELRDHMKARGIRRPVEQLATDCQVSATTVFNWIRDGYVTQLDHGIALAEASQRYGLPMAITRFRKPATVIPFPDEPKRAARPRARKGGVMPARYLGVRTHLSRDIRAVVNG